MRPRSAIGRPGSLSANLERVLTFSLPHYDEMHYYYYYGHWMYLRLDIIEDRYAIWRGAESWYWIIFKKIAISDISLKCQYVWLYMYSIIFKNCYIYFLFYKKCKYIINTRKLHLMSTKSKNGKLYCKKFRSFRNFVYYLSYYYFSITV